MRGKERDCSQGRNIAGITPAYAGKSGFTSRPKCNIRDHPRLCGEKEDEPAVLYIVLGSPPPMRGKGRMPREGMWEIRITPPYAGKRQENSVDYNTDKDHPRLCGEKMKMVMLIMTLQGSPPPMRGKEIPI